MKAKNEISTAYHCLIGQLEEGNMDGQERETKIVIDTLGYCLDLDPKYNVDALFPSANTSEKRLKEGPE